MKHIFLDGLSVFYWFSQTHSFEDKTSELWLLDSLELSNS